MDENDRLKFGEYLKRLRIENRLSLRQVEKEVSISNSYLYQIERGEKNPPKVEILKKLATLYKINLSSLMQDARMEEPTDTELYYDQLENAIEFVRKDNRFAFGNQMTSASLSPEAKRFVVEAYQKATGTDLLGELKKVHTSDNLTKQAE